MIARNAAADKGLKVLLYGLCVALGFRVALFVFDYTLVGGSASVVWIVLVSAGSGAAGALLLSLVGGYAWPDTLREWAALCAAPTGALALILVLLSFILSEPQGFLAACVIFGVMLAIYLAGLLGSWIGARARTRHG